MREAINNIQVLALLLHLFTKHLLVNAMACGLDSHSFIFFTPLFKALYVSTIP